MEHPYGFLSLAPPVIAILFAIVTRRVILAMLLGIVAGSLVMSDLGGQSPIIAVLKALRDTWEVHLWPALIDAERLRVFSFTLLMGALIGVVTKSGGMQGLVLLVSRWAKSRKQGQLTAWLLGLVIFFDDYANTMLLGPTLRPIMDRLRVSREKLAYIVDSTAAPVAGLAVVSTWVAVEINYVRSGLINANPELDQSALTLFLATIPYRFYVWLALILVPLVVLTRREFPGMYAAEQQILDTGKIDRKHPSVAKLDEGTKPSGWYNAIIPILFNLLVTLFFIYMSGREKLSGSPTLYQILENSNSSLALQYGAFAGLLLAWIMVRYQKILSAAQLVDASMSGARVVAGAIVILWFASTISTMTGNKSSSGEISTQFAHRDHRLYTGDYLKSVLVVSSPVPADQNETGQNAVAPVSTAIPRFPLFLLPTVVFVLSAIVAFCTGTSWGTMGIIMPVAIPLAYTLLSTSVANPSAILEHPLLIGSIAGVLSGAIFGDHCSPISDTTVLSSQSSGCDHLAHTWTQLPYAFFAGAICIVFGTLPLGLGFSLWILWPAQLLALYFGLILFGKKLRDPSLDIGNAN
jgi:Na+/H+ antiporter NhaC